MYKMKPIYVMVAIFAFAMIAISASAVYSADSEAQSDEKSTYTIVCSFNEGGAVKYTVGTETFYIEPTQGEERISIESGSTVTFFVTSSSNYEILSVNFDDEEIFTLSSNVEYVHSFPEINNDHVFRVTFIEKREIIATADNGGSISPNGNIKVIPGESQEFNISADDGYIIKSVEVDGHSIGAVTSYTFENVDANHTIHATFTKASFTITATANNGGSISPSGDTKVIPGESQEFNISADKGYRISSVEVDGHSIGAVTSYMFENVDADHTITAKFSKIPMTYKVSVSAGEGGKVIGSTSAQEGGTVRLSIVPDEGFVIASQTVDGSLSSENPVSFSNITSNHTLSVTFRSEGTKEITELEDGKIMEIGNIIDGDLEMSYTKISKDGSVLEMNAKAEDTTKKVWAAINRTESGNTVEIGGNLLDMPIAGLSIDTSKAAVLNKESLNGAFEVLSNLEGYVGNDVKDPDPYVVLDIPLGGDGNSSSMVNISNDTLMDIKDKKCELVVVSSFITTKYSLDFIEFVSTYGKDITLLSEKCELDSLTEPQRNLLEKRVILHFAVLVGDEYLSSANGMIDANIPVKTNAVGSLTVICVDRLGDMTESVGELVDDSFSFKVSKMSYYGVDSSLINNEVNDPGYDLTLIALIVIAIIVCVIVILFVVKTRASRRK